MEQLVTIVAVCRLAILKRMPATPLTLLVAHRVREQVKVQVQRSGMTAAPTKKCAATSDLITFRG